MPTPEEGSYFFHPPAPDHAFLTWEQAQKNILRMIAGLDPLEAIPDPPEPHPTGGRSKWTSCPWWATRERPRRQGTLMTTEGYFYEVWDGDAPPGHEDWSRPTRLRKVILTPDPYWNNDRIVILVDERTILDICSGPPDFRWTRSGA